MAFNLKLPGLGGGKQSGPADQTIAAQTVMDVGGAKAKKGAALGFLNQYSVNKQLQILGGVLLLVLSSLAAVVIYHDNRESNTARPTSELLVKCECCHSDWPRPPAWRCRATR